MKVDVLVATMDQVDHSLIEKMNLKSNAIIANQCDKTSFEKFEYNGKTIRFISFNEKGVGLNRNNALMRSEADICIIADDDLVYVDNYLEIVIKSFAENPTADVILFNLIENPVTRYVTKEKFRVNTISYTKFGAARIAFRRKSIVNNGVFFNLCFGGGTEHSNGEDTLFLYECLKKKLKIIAVPYYIATLVNTRESTWFNGYTEKYFMDTGALYSLIFKNTFHIRSLYFCFKRYKKYKKSYSILEAYKFIRNGSKEFKMQTKGNHKLYRKE